MHFEAGYSTSQQRWSQDIFTRQTHLTRHRCQDREGLRQDKTVTLLKCLKLRQCQGTVIKTHYSHKTTTTRTIVLQYISKQPVTGPSGLFSTRNASASAQNKHLAMSDRDTVKTQSRDMRHDETEKLETRAKTRHTSVTWKTMSRDSPETRHVPRTPSLAGCPSF